MPKEDALTPVPTYWVKRTPEGEPRSGVLLLLKAYPLDEDVPVVFELGYWSEKTHQFVAVDGNAIEENFEIDSYHIVHNTDGEPIEL